MTILLFDGFETYGDTSTAGATVESNLDAVSGSTAAATQFDMDFNRPASNPTDIVTIVDDQFSEGFAVQFPVMGSAQSVWIGYEFPSAGQGTTNASVPEIIVGFRYYHGALDRSAGTGPLIRNIAEPLAGSSLPGSTTNMSIEVNEDDELYVDVNGTQTPVYNVSEGTWYFIEVKYKMTTSANGGYATLWVNGDEIGTVNDSVIGFTFFNCMGWRFSGGMSGGNNLNPGSEGMRIDDFYALVVDGTHSDRLGVVRVLYQDVNSDATPNDWSPSTGSDNYAMLGDNDWDTSTYVEAATNGDDDHYGIEGFAVTPTTVHAVRVDSVVVATDGTPTLHIGLDDGTADELSMGVVSTGSNELYVGIYPDDPSGAAWTASSVESIEATQRMTE